VFGSEGKNERILRANEKGTWAADVWEEDERDERDEVGLVFAGESDWEVGVFELETL
jgi:hypothetical protein